MTSVKKYRRILAGLLAVNMTVSGLLADVVSVSANENTYNDENNVSIEETQEYSAEVESGMDTSVSDDSISIGEDVIQSDENTDTDSTEDMTDIVESEVIQETEDGTNAAEEVQEEEQILGEETEETETESESETETEEVDVQAARVAGEFDISLFGEDYDPDTNTVKIDSPQGLILLSHCKPEQVEKVNIYIGGSGKCDISQEIPAGTDLSTWFKAAKTNSEATAENMDAVESDFVVIQSNDEKGNDAAEIEESSKVSTQEIIVDTAYTYQGLGTEEHPFRGKIDGLGRRIDTNVSFFKVLSSEATCELDNYAISWIGDGSQPMLADTYVFESEGDHTLPLSIQTVSETETIGSLIGTVKAADGINDPMLTLGNFDSLYANGTIDIRMTAGNAGLICNTVEDGTICLDGYPIPTGAYTVAATSGNAGGLIGELEENTKLQIKDTVSLNGVTITSNSAAAGGIVGVVGNNAQVVMENTATFANLSVNGSTAAGGMSGAMSSGAQIQTEKNASITFNTKTVVKSTGGTAGGFVGTMTTGSKIQTNATVTFNAATTVTTASGSGAAGGLIGSMEPGAQIITGDGANITLNSPNVEITENGTASATGGAGGVVGKADSVTFETLQSDIVVENSSVGGKQYANVGGFIGDYTLNEDNVAEELTFPEHIKMISPTVWVNGTGGNSGGYFGILNFNGKIKYTLGTEDEKKVDFFVIYKTNGGVSQRYGAIAGQTTSTDKESTLIIQNLNIDSNFTTGSIRPQYHGGLVGQIGNNNICSYVEVKDVDIKITNSHAGNYFGGITAYLSKQSILRSYNIKIVAAGNDTSLWEGGGILGYANVGSVLELSGITDLTDVGYQGRYQVAQLVRENNNGLIFARGDGNGDGWTYKRSRFAKYSSYINDIGNYGQVIRLKSSEESNVNKGLSYNLITITDEHDVILPEKDWSGNITLSSADDFALLSIAWNSRGNFSADSKSISTSSWTNLYSKNITLTDDIDLTGTGISCLTRDSSEGEQEYVGTFSGDSEERTLTLSIGETFGYQNGNLAVDGADGCGKVYAYNKFHDYQGIFAKFKSTDTGSIKQITLAGSVNVSNAGGAITVGGIAASANGAERSVTTEKVIVQEKIIVDAPKGNRVSVGGFFGSCSFYTNIMLTDNTISDVDITIQNTADDANDKIFAGSVIGRDIKKLICDGLTVRGSITSDEQRYAYVGGLIGIISDYSNADKEDRWIEIRDLTYDGLKISAPQATEVCGGLFGSIWSRTGVYFTKNPNGLDGEDTKLLVKDATIDAPKAKGVGGLAYRASGIWEIRSNGIDIKKLVLNAGKDVGLLICHGEKETEIVEGESRTFGALYLDTLQYWKDSYKLDDIQINVTQPGVFDEFVAYTAASEAQITENGVNGVISLATKEEGTERVGVDKKECTTYQNRTEYGKQHNTNGCSRYYYDLDQCMEKAAEATATDGNGRVDTPEELLLWSVHRYACQNIKEYLTRSEKQQKKIVDDVKNDVKLIGNASEPKLTLDMEGYSYYPVNLDGSVTVQYVTLEFHNQEIEKFEETGNNKLTSAADEASQTQHYTMHCGLFLNHINGNEATTVNVNNVAFKGTIGKVNDNAGSGVLFAGNIQGRQEESTIYLAKVNITGIEFDDLMVTNCEMDYAPLLINQISSYTTLEIDRITNNYEGGTAVASSLIGNVGSSTGKQINLSFQNISLPDNTVENKGSFTHATLLESFEHDGSSSVAAYNFYYRDDWDTDTEKYTHKNVTYGWEISHSVEYVGQQEWYYDEATHGRDEGVVRKEKDTKLDSSGYLRYVCNIYDNTKYTHEIKVNQRVADITSGCGTYGHPYQITTEGQMTIIAEYLATATPRKDWRITITKDQSKYHTDKSGDITYQYNSSIWEEVTRNEADDDWTVVSDGETLDNRVMLQYMLNAYYDIQGATSGDHVNTLTLTNFAGFGISSRPFRGVLTSSTNATLYLEGTGTCNGLIPYSYGSVVRELTIWYQGTGKTLTYTSGTTRTSNYYPDVCFGGVIGCILGGDNIIEDVTVRMEPDWLTLEGDKKHLIPTGGYVGAVCGGGVLFRGTISGTGLTDTMLFGDNVSVEAGALKSMYVNPYVGRVLDGFAFNESTSEIENTDKNYQINPLNTAGKITTTDTMVTVSGSQGLLLLSAVVNSGAASGGISNAYGYGETKKNNANALSPDYVFGGAYGKVRKASYDHIGKGTADEEVGLANSDDQSMPGDTNLPYLLNKYGDTGCISISNSTDMQIELENATYNMADYGSGYQGIAARYVSNAVLNGNAPDAKGIVPVLKEMDGNGSTLILNTQVKEYADDDFHVASVGGVWNLLRLSNESTGTIQNLTIQGKLNTDGTVSGGVSLTYYTSTGSEATDTSTWATFNKSVEVGGIAGATSNISATSNTSKANISFNNIQMKYMDIEGPNNAGGLLGSSGRTVPETKPANYAASDIAILLEPISGNRISAGISVTNSQYNKITIDATNAVGGFVGYVDSNDNVDVSSSLSVTHTDITTVGKDATLGNESILYAGGAFGYVKTKVYINSGANGTENYQDAVMEGIKILAKRAAGGFIGSIDGKEYHIQKATFKGTEGLDAWIKLKNYVVDDKIGAGGIVGFAKGAATSNEILNCNFKDAQINELSDTLIKDQERYKRAGGIVGVITNGQVSIEDAAVSGAKIYGTIVGGIAGDVQKKTVFSNCTVTGYGEKDQSEMNGFDCAGGIVGFFNTKDAVALHNCNLQYLKIGGKNWSCGGFIGDSDDSNVGTLHLFDCAENNINITGSGWSYNRIGGIIGNLRGSIAASNVLISKVAIENGKQQGNLFGLVRSIAGQTINIAGISLQEQDAAIGLYNVQDNADISSKTYISFSDYSGSALNDSIVGNGEKKKLLKIPSTSLDSPDTIETPVAPYVVTSPVRDFYVSAREETTNSEKKLYLYGDGASWTGEGSTFTVEAQNIFKNKDSVVDGHYPYKKTGVDTFKFEEAISTYNTNQSDGIDSDFPVLQITAGDTETVTQYLNILTNGGFSEANKLNSESTVHVKANAYVYQKSTEGTFIRDNSQNPAFKVNTDENNQISFSTTTDYDNDRNRFTLLEVTFTEKDESGNSHEYNVLVPILVRRMLEIDFSATLSYGTNFRSESYKGLTAHVLESFGNAITGYLVYTYDSKKGTYTDYGWQSYIDAGGNVAEAMEKTICFINGKLPKGTQLSLIDCQNDSKVYYHEITDAEASSGKVAFSEFKDSNNNAYVPSSMAESMKVTAIEDENGKFIKVQENGAPEGNSDANYSGSKPTVRIRNAKGEYEYYRLAEAGETGTHKISVPEGMTTFQETYYMVITVPENSASQELNGWIQTEVQKESHIPHNIHPRLLAEDRDDDYDNTASSYVLSSGYKQVLTENLGGEQWKKLSTADSSMQVDVVDTITFPKKQAYQDQDKLYVRFIGNLNNTEPSENSENVTQTSAVLFPAGTSGTAEFYIYVENGTQKTYYTYAEAGGWTEANGETSAFSYPWIATNGKMELPLSTDGTNANAVSLDGIRKIVKGTENSGYGEFKVELKMTATIPSTDLDVIPQSTLGTSDSPDKYAKLAYTSQLSTVRQSLTYSSNRASCSGTLVGYYREEAIGASLSYEADDIGQLGINLLDLQHKYLDKDNVHALINTTAEYKLSAVKNLDEVLAKSTGIKFTLKLLPKKTATDADQEEYQEALSDAGQYMQIQLTSKNPEGVTAEFEDDGWSWTIPQSSYWEKNEDGTGNIVTSDIFNGTSMFQTIQLQVNVTGIENDEHYYSNYKVLLTAEIVGGGIESSSNEIIYTLAKIRPEFVTN